MYYYKALADGQIVDAMDSLQCVRYFEKIGILRCKEKEQPQGIISTDGQHIWQVEGWPEFPEAAGWDDATVTLTEIDRETYMALREALDAGAETIPEPEPEPEPEPVDRDTLEFVRSAKIDAMSAACQSAITAGFSITGTDGTEHHYSMQVTDQIMIAQLALKAQTGAEQLPWHADGEPCRFYTAAEILAINERMEQLITYHQTYFNSLKQWILAMQTITEVYAVQYGMDIPEVFRSAVLRQLLGGAE